MLAPPLYLIQLRPELLSLWSDFWGIDVRINLTLAQKNYGTTIAPNYALERQPVPLEDEYLFKDHAFWNELEYVPISLFSSFGDPIL